MEAEESKNSESDKTDAKVFILVGDSGVGKSSFVNCMMKRNVAFAP